MTATHAPETHASHDVTCIWAQARDAAGRPVIGAGNAIPWHVPEDFAHFKTLTAGHPVIMGRATWESLPTKPLPGRTNIVLTPDALPDDGATPAASLVEAFEAAVAAPGGDQIWVMGGGSVYRQILAAGLADRLEVTEIDLEVDGDTYAPTIGDGWTADNADWQTAVNGTRYRFVTYRR
ncbi:MAG: dihydrofolate reductase [Cellulomonadaceae bacterium]|jgi:dihydrofolate reductase|nr:dihydrofolate reductase [Cellulomonadaceae bacterium]